MAGRPRYDVDTKARIYVALRANEGNLKKTSREEGIPVNTLRNWRNDWEMNKNIPDANVIDIAYGDFLKNVEDARNRAVGLISQGLEGLDPTKLSMGDLKNLAVVVGVLDDKWNRAKGLDRDRNLHVHHHLPAADELRDLMGGYVTEQIEQAQHEVVDADYVEVVPQLPA